MMKIYMYFSKPSLIALPLLLFFPFFSYALSGEKLYKKYCSSCHGKNRIGKTAPPLIPEFLRKKSDKELKRIIKEGLPASQMPPFTFFSDAQLKHLINYLRTPVKDIEFSLKEIEKSYIILKAKPKDYEIRNLKNLTVAVDKKGKIYIFEGEHLLDKFEFKNVHGGVKFSLKNSKFYIPARDGWIISYDYKEKRPISKVRACIYLRNITITPDEEKVIAGCVLPRSIVILDKDLKPLKQIKVEGRISGVYQLSKYSSVIIAYRDTPKLSILKEGKIKSYKISAPLEDFFIDPFEEYVIGSSRKENKLFVYRLKDFKKVFEAALESMPHLFAVSFLYKNGKFYFVARHISGNVSIWRLYDWKLVKTISTQEKGFFVRTHFKNFHLWLDTLEPYALLINKKTYELSEVRITEKGKFSHVEFSGDGNLAYLSVLGEGLKIVDAFTLKEIKKYPLKHPVGKYNILLKTRKFYPAFLGYQVYMEKCWGCHHLTQEAFGPPLKWVAKNRDMGLILSQIANPKKTFRLLGYKKNAMPKIQLSAYELIALKNFLEVLRDGWIN
ncbi:MAG TPA: c-type cytochrome [Aquificaceae bacterium]|nr:c-type cytochrome [Aquificaceae bacterium]HIQ49076.1 c-type cytochrome [Aquifex aeolicus]